MPPEPAAPTVWTVRALVNWTTEYLHTKAAIAPADARKEARMLVSHVLGCTQIETVARYDDVPTDAERSAYRDLIRRRVDGWPVAYLVGRREFYLLTFEVSPAVLIPRPDTETLVLEALNRLTGIAAPSVLDLGTGSGCVAISLAHRTKSARVAAVDVSPDALEVAKRNAATHGVEDRIDFHLGDLFGPLPEGAKFDLIVSNPPYIADGEFADLAPDVRDHEPRLALAGGPDGLAFYRRISADAGRYLKPGGWVLVEIGWTQNDAVRAIFADRPEFTLVDSAKDMGNRHRVVMATRV